MSDRVSGETLRDWAGDAYAKDEASDDELRAMARELLDARARIAELEKMLAAMEAQYWEAWREPLRARLALAEE